MTEEQVLAEVQALRALIEERYSTALQTHHYEWLKLNKNRDALSRFQANMSQVFTHKDRDQRIEVMNLLAPLCDSSGQEFELTSANDLWFAEMSGWIGWLESSDAINCLRTIISGLEYWRERLKGQEPVTRPRVYVPTFEEEEAAVPF